MSNTDLLGWMRRSDKLLRQRCEFRRQRVRVKDEKGREWIESVEQVDRYEFTKEVRLNMRIVIYSGTAMLIVSSTASRIAGLD
jgi:hypothetical protein